MTAPAAAAKTAPVELYDAHNHLQDQRLDPWRDDLARQLPALGLRQMVVNGTSPGDWPQVAALAKQYPWVRPAFGLHPWQVKERAPGWREQLDALLRAHPRAGIGETGLDRWIENPDIPAQLDCFRWQMARAAAADRPLTVHCLRAFGLLEQELRRAARPACGFLLHSYGGPVEMVPAFVKLGAYFSLSPYFFHPRKHTQLQTFKAVPPERLLIETDAPDMRPPAGLNPHPLRHPGDGSELNSPANLRFAYEKTAALLALPLPDLAAQVAENYHRLFGPVEA